MASMVLMIGKLCFAAVGVAIGHKLARELRRGDGFGLHVVALAAITVGGVGLITISVGQALDSPIVALGGDVGMRVGMVLLCAFIWRTFRPDGAVGMLTALLCSAALIGTLIWDALNQPSLVDYDFSLASAHASQIGVALPFAWTTAESALLWSRARRRLQLGLADHETVSRYLLWTVATACFVGICALAIAAGEALAAGYPVAADGAQATRGLLYLVISFSIWRGIFPRAGARPQPEASAQD